MDNQPNFYAIVHEMGSKGRPLFDLNEPPTEDDEDHDEVFSFQPQRAVPSSSTQTSDLFAVSSNAQGIVNNRAFSHASSVSGFQPFVRPNSAKESEVSGGRKNAGTMIAEFPSSSKSNKVENVKAGQLPELSNADARAVEKEEGEWSDAEGSGDAYRSSNMHEELANNNEISKEKEVGDMRNSIVDAVAAEEDVPQIEDVKVENGDLASSGVDPDINDRKSNSSRNSESSSMNGPEDSAWVPKQKEVRGVEASYALKLANNPGKRPRLDQYKEVQLGKKRSRQTMFLNLEDVKQVGALKSSTPRRQNFPAPVTTRTVKEGRLPLPVSERAGEKQVDSSNNEGNGCLESNDPESECNGEINTVFSRSRRLNSSTALGADTQSTTISRQSSWKQSMDLRPAKNSQIPSRKTSFSNLNVVDTKLGAKKLPSKKQPAINTQYQDTSVERLLREVTNEKFWHHPGINFLN